MERFLSSKTKWGAYALAAVALDRACSELLGFNLLPAALAEELVLGIAAFIAWAMRDAIPAKGGGVAKLLRTRPPRE